MSIFRISLVILCLISIVKYTYAMYDWGWFNFSMFRDNQYLARFAVDKDAIFTARARMRLKDPYRVPFSSEIKVLLMNDMEWDFALESEDCAHRANLARFTIPVNLNSNGMWSKWEQTRISIKNRPQVWYILASDCDKQTHAQFPDLSVIEYELELFNDGSHFSHEHWGMLPITFLTLCLFSYLLVQTGIKLYRQISKEDEYESPMVFLAAAIYLEFSHLGLIFMHLMAFWYNGYGFWWMEYFATLCEILSQASIVTLITMIAFGWTLTFDHLRSHENYKMIVVLNLLAHLVIAALTIVDDGEHHKYHDFEGLQGFLLVLIRLGFFTIMLYKIRDTQKLMSKKNLAFLKGFSISSSIYILCFPVLYLTSYLLNPHMRFKFIMFGNLLVQMVAVIILINQITKKHSKYYEASKMSQTVLPNKMN